MIVIIPAAGYATRLYPLTQNQPKALLDSNGKPILDRIVQKIAEMPGIIQIAIISNEKFIYEFEHWQKSANSKIPIELINDGSTSEGNKLGTIGDLQFAIDELKLNEDFFVVNADNLFNFSITEFQKFAQGKASVVVGLYDKKSKESVAGKYGIVEIDKNSKVIGFEEKPLQPKSALISTGIYFFPKAAIPLIKQFLEEGNKSDAPGYFLQWLFKKQDVYSFLFKKDWYDIGSFEELGQARKDFKD